MKESKKNESFGWFETLNSDMEKTERERERVKQKALKASERRKQRAIVSLFILPFLLFLAFEM